MNYILLIGAGFSRNWGGWVASEAFEYLLGCPEIQADVRLRELLWSHQLKGGFEDALAELQGGGISYAREPWAESQLIAFQNAVGRMFEAMNSAFLDLEDMEFQRDAPDRMVWTLLTRFHDIFSLNQDIFLEQFYLVDKMVRAAVKPYVPGMRRTPNAEPIFSDSLSRAMWNPRPSSEFRLQSGCQPFFKLHGSSNWFTDDGRRLLIMGGAKQQEIGRNPILKWYAQQFADSLLRPNSRLMIIGYGFRDLHVNAAIDAAVTQGLKILVIDPAGAELAFKLNETRQRGQIQSGSPLEDMLKQALIGGSRRGLAEIFRNDNAEFSKVMRFFA